jgi:mannose-6-phosphate isomerase-like protein (cupin superfamily)
MPDTTITWPGHIPQQTSSLEAAGVQAPALVVTGPHEAPPLRAFGDEIYVHLGGAETGGQYTAFTDITPPGSGPPPHYHENEDEWFFPLEGRVEFFLDGSWQEVPVQSVVFIPRGMVHTFRNCGDRPLTMLIHTAPSGFEIFFKRCAEEFAKPGPPDMGRIVEIGAEHGIHFVTE